MSKRTTFVICVVIALIIIMSGCGKSSIQKEEATTSLLSTSATIDEATSPQEETIDLHWHEAYYLSNTLSEEVDWESLYYERLRNLYDESLSECALIYLNDDDVPELYIKSSADDHNNYLSYISDDGLFVKTEVIDETGNLWYLERHNKYLFGDESLENGTVAKTPEMVSMNEMISQLKDERKNPEIKAGDYYGNADSLVSTYKEVSGSAVFNDESKPLYYRIPQINVDGEDINRINQEILEDMLEYVSWIEQEIKDAKDEIWPCTYKTIDYHAYLNHGVFSLVIDKKGLGSGATDGSDGPDSKIIYNIDASTGKEIGNICLLNSYGIDSRKVSSAFADEVKEEYDSIKNDPEHPINNPESGFDENVYDYLYNSTMEQFSPVGYYNRMYFDDEGNLNIVYWYKWVAGSEFYNNVMTLNAEEIV